MPPTDVPNWLNIVMELTEAVLWFSLGFATKALLTILKGRR